jgi:hypothetical protein
MNSSTVPLLHTTGSLATEAQLVVAMTQDFVTDFLPALAWLVALTIIALLVTCVCTRVWALTLRACRVPMSWTQLTKILLGATLLFLGISLAFGAVGINFSGIFFGASVFAAAIIVSASDLTKDFFVGLQLHSFGVLDDHETVKLPGDQNGSLTGTLRSIGVFTSELVVTSNTAAGNDYVKETLLIPNRYMFDGPLTVEWETKRRKDKGAGFLSAAERSKESTSASTSLPDTRFIAQKQSVAGEPATSAPPTRSPSYSLKSMGTSGPSSTLTRRVAALSTITSAV